MKNFQCPCEGISTEEEIDEATLDMCVNRQQRRMYKPIGMTTNISRTWYKCPKCGSEISRKDWKLV